MRNLRQDITYWAPAAQNAYGERTFDTPVVLKGRWEDQIDLARNMQGEEITSKASVYLSGDVIEGGWLAPGDQTDLADPRQAVGSTEVKAFSAIPDLRFMDKERRAYL